jgi:hypothetical protein
LFSGDGGGCGFQILPASPALALAHYCGKHGTRSNCKTNRNAITALNYDRPHINSKTSE